MTNRFGLLSVLEAQQKYCYLKYWAAKIAHQVTYLATKNDDLNLIPKIYMVERVEFHKFSDKHQNILINLKPTHTHIDVCTQTYIHTHIHMK